MIMITERNVLGFISAVSHWGDMRFPYNNLLTSWHQYLPQILTKKDMRGIKPQHIDDTHKYFSHHKREPTDTE